MSLAPIDGSDREPLLEELVEKARRGDVRAFTEVAEQMAPRVMAVARMILRDDDLAAEATQDTLVRMWIKLPRLRRPDRLQGWVHVITVNECRQELRRNRRRERLANQLDEPIPTGAGASLADRDEMGAAFARLRNEHREVPVLRYYLDLTPDEIARTLGARPGTVRSRLHHALRSLRAELESERRAQDALDGPDSLVRGRP